LREKFRAAQAKIENSTVGTGLEAINAMATLLKEDVCRRSDATEFKWMLVYVQWISTLYSMHVRAMLTLIDHF
jgi:cytochrome c